MNGRFTTINNDNKLFSQYNNNIHVTRFRTGTRIDFEQGWVGIVDHRRRWCDRVKKKGQGYTIKVGVSTHNQQIRVNRRERISTINQGLINTCHIAK